MSEARYPYDVVTVEIVLFLTSGKKPKKRLATTIHDVSDDIKEGLKDYDPRYRLILIGKAMKALVKDGYVLLDRAGLYSLTPRGEMLAKNISTGEAIKDHLKTIRHEQMAVIIGGAHRGQVR